METQLPELFTNLICISNRWESGGTALQMTFNVLKCIFLNENYHILIKIVFSSGPVDK